MGTNTKIALLTKAQKGGVTMPASLSIASMTTYLYVAVKSLVPCSA